MDGHEDCSLNTHGVVSCAKNYVSDNEGDKQYWALESFEPTETYIVEPIVGRLVSSRSIFAAEYESDEQLLTYFRLMSNNH
jgi:hypothetical protein